MADDANETGVILWGGLRQLEALRDAMEWALAGNAVGDHSKAGVLQWLREQGLGEVTPTGGTPPAGSPDHLRDFRFLPTLASGTEDYRLKLLGSDFVKALQRGQRSAQPTDDYGWKRSGAGWQNAANFCITSAFIRVLGAWEQYELDVLKALVHYRSSGKKVGPKAEQLIIKPELEVVLEEPAIDEKDQNKRFYKLTPEWSTVKKDLENNIKRATFFSQRYAIDAIPGLEGEKKANRKRRTAWYEKRNKIVHGREEVEMRLSEYLEVDVFVYRSMEYVAIQCLEQHKLLV